MNARPLIILTVLVVAIVGAAMWFLNSQPTPVLPAAITAPATPPPIERPITPPPPRSTPPPRQASTARTESTEMKPEPAIAEWELKIDQVLRTEAGETETAQMLINMLPTLPADGQAEAAQHITNLILDEQYARVMPLVRNPALPEEVHDVLLTDLMNREDAVKLPTLLEIAKQPTHPSHEEALIDLEIFLDEEFGTDWAKWDAAVKKYVAAQEAEEAEAAAANPTEPAITQ